ncbi:MAG: hypothetical protein KGH62_01965 [Candidatus Micrarchaeota archaeon]|nr:hypothetical protein [Candidatus Micrarchaeota archaeon]
MKSNTIMWALVVLAVAGVLTGYIKLPTSAQNIAAPPGGSSSSSTSGVTVNQCPSNPTLSLTMFYPNASANAGLGGITQAAVAFNAFQSGTITNIGTGASSKTVSTTTGSGAVTCSQAYLVFFGDNANGGGSAYYTNATSVTSGYGQTTQVKGITFLYSAPTLTSKNNTQTGFLAGSEVHNVANGQTLTSSQIQIQIQAGQGWFGYPGQNFAADFAYNPSVVTSIGIPGYQQVSQGLLPVETPYAGDVNIAFQVPSISNYQAVVISPTIQLGTIPAYSGATGQNSLSTQNALALYLIPQVNYMYAAPSGVEQLVTGVYVKPGVAGNVAAGVVTSNTAFIGFAQN